MHQIRLDDQLYQEAQRRAAESGFANVDEYVANVLQSDIADTDELNHLFTPERLAEIDHAAAQIAAGNGLTTEQADAELAKRREEWLRRKS
ncbi:MAG TPA: hypothetical protein VHZ24_03715 [Pirellulales bacterium]|jgi:hypothetical protein|nr:hypothetical protein [Pirellulales bacterium]